MSPAAFAVQAFPENTVTPAPPLVRVWLSEAEVHDGSRDVARVLSVDEARALRDALTGAISEAAPPAAAGAAEGAPHNHDPDEECSIYCPACDPQPNGCCSKCQAMMHTREGDEPTDLCDHCAHAEVSSLRAELAQERSCRLANEQELRRADAEIGTLRAELTQERAALQAEREARERLEGRCAAATDERDALRAVMDRMNGAVHDAEARATTAEREVERLTNEIAARRLE